jgi:hypothetical protein
MNLIGNINAIPFRRFRGGGGVAPFPSISGIIARYSALGLTNEQMAENPVWKDLTGNGHDLQMKNFAWKGMSGVNGYVENFNQWFVGFDESNKTVSDSSMKLVLLESDSQKVIYDKTAHQIGYTYNFYIKVTGIEGRTLNVKSGTLGNIIMSITEDGIYSINTTISDDWGNNMLYLIFPPSSSSNTVTIEQLPIYPGFILGDGVDDFAVTEKELNFEDTYTVYTAFIPFQDDPARNMILCGKNETKDFSINYSGTHINFQPSTGVNLVPRINQFMLLVCKRNKDTTTIINLSTGESKSLSSKEFITNPGLYYLWRNVYATFLARAAIAGQTICNGYLSTDEDDEKVLNYYKQEYSWLFPDQAWTVTGKTNEDTNRATIANITGNGNNLVLSNFGFAENSGYGLYAYNFNSFTLKDNAVKPTDVKNDSFRIVGTGDGSNVSVLLNVSNSANWKIRVTGMKEGDNLIVGNANKSGDYFTITKDGIYTFQKQYEASSTNGVWYNSAQEVDVLVEQIPEYEGYLVTDGVDDKIVSSVFGMGKDFTIVGDWKFIDNKKSGTGLVKGSSFYIYNTMIGLDLFINSGSVKNSLDGIKSINAACSDGRAYDRNWNEILANTGNVVGSGGTLEVSSSGGRFDRIAFKNLAIYPRILSKDDCIKAYNYLQTLKAK